MKILWNFNNDPLLLISISSPRMVKSSKIFYFIEQFYSNHLISMLSFTWYLSPTPPCSCAKSKQIPSDHASSLQSCSRHNSRLCIPSPRDRWVQASWEHWTQPSSPFHCCTRVVLVLSLRLLLLHCGWGPVQQPTTYKHFPFD